MKIKFGLSYSALVSVVYQNNLIKESNLIEAIICANSYLNRQLSNEWNVTISPTNFNSSLENKTQEAIRIRNNANYSAVIGLMDIENCEFLYPYIEIKPIPYIVPFQQLELSIKDYPWLVKMTSYYQWRS